MRLRDPLERFRLVRLLPPPPPPPDSVCFRQPPVVGFLSFPLAAVPFSFPFPPSFSRDQIKFKNPAAATARMKKGREKGKEEER